MTQKMDVNIKPAIIFKFAVLQKGLYLLTNRIQLYANGIFASIQWPIRAILAAPITIALFGMLHLELVVHSTLRN